MASHITLRGLASRLLRPTALPIRSLASSHHALPTLRMLSTTTTTPAKFVAPAGSKLNKGKAGGKGKKQRKKGQAAERDPKIVNMLRTMALLGPRRIPPPLRMARNRYLRHWTIHRAWLLFRRRLREARETVLMQQHNSMSKACEELRTTRGPDTRPEGYLFRMAMEKKGVYGHHGVPIEYARPQTETPAREPWNHGWKR